VDVSNHLLETLEAVAAEFGGAFQDGMTDGKNVLWLLLVLAAICLSFLV
jgi:hypothetical protein